MNKLFLKKSDNSCTRHYLRCERIVEELVIKQFLLKNKMKLKGGRRSPSAIFRRTLFVIVLTLENWPSTNNRCGIKGLVLTSFKFADAPEC